MVHHYDLTGMHCQACAGRIGAALRGVPGVTEAEVTLQPPRARVETSRHVPTETLDQAVRKAGDYRLSDAAGGASHGAMHGDPLAVIDAPVRSHAMGAAPSAPAEPAPKESLYPLALIVGYIAGAVVLVAWATQNWAVPEMMRHFMAGFFLVFSFFKLLDLRGFVDAYRGYDLVARAAPAWAWAYPFVELALGAAYLVDAWPTATNIVALAVMSVGAVGVLKALLDKRAIRCACLGTALNLPMTTVTLVEDVAMAAMAAAMLAMA